MHIKIKNNSFIVNKNIQLIIVGISVQLVYLLISKYYYQIGFPLDDSWIHQTYARNLIEYGGWYFVPGIPSTGSTSPLWTFFLIPGFIFKANFFYYWTFALSGIIFISSAVLFQKLFEKITKVSPNIPWAGFLFLLEWHLVWSVNSGMETILYIFVILIIFYYLITRKSNYLWVCWLLLGLVIFIRPDGVTLIGPYLMLNFIYVRRKETSAFKNGIFGLMVVISIVFLYALFNHQIAGEFLPNTFFAKQAEYQVLYSKPLISRILDMFLVSLTGAGILLLPGFLYYFYVSISKKYWEILSAYFWFFGYLLIYAIRLPVTYQHGRYVIPTIPIFLLLSAVGTYFLLQGALKEKKLLIFGYKVAVTVILFIFFVLGGRALAEDVAIIQTEMVDTAKWIHENLPASSVIAAHDIGALGFYANRQIVDLAGLISPEVIPFIRDEEQLSNYMDLNGVNYLVVFPGWYTELDQSKIEIFSTNGKFSPQAGGENMTIYIWEQ